MSVAWMLKAFWINATENFFLIQGVANTAIFIETDSKSSF